MKTKKQPKKFKHVRGMDKDRVGRGEREGNETRFEQGSIFRQPAGGGFRVFRKSVEG